MYRYQNDVITRIERAISQRLYLLKEIERTTTSAASDNNFSRLFDVLGSHGDVYHVIIGQHSKCSCPDWLRRKEHCKHIYFILHRYLKVPLYSELLTLSTFDDIQLAQIFSIQNEHQQKSNAHTLAPHDNNILDRYTTIFDHKKNTNVEPKQSEEKVKEKLLEEDEACPICLEEMTMNDVKQPLLWCKTQCGKHMHEHCLKHWAKAMTSSGTRHTTSCPLCRAPWQEMNVNTKKRHAPSSKEYINLLD
jgi:hypothetical protein